jgi:hypothetical protein
MIERLAIEGLIGLIAICAVVPLGLRYIMRARREVSDIVAEERDRLQQPRNVTPVESTDSTQKKIT